MFEHCFKRKFFASVRKWIQFFWSGISVYVNEYVICTYLMWCDVMWMLIAQTKKDCIFVVVEKKYVESICFASEQICQLSLIQMIVKLLIQYRSWAYHKWNRIGRIIYIKKLVRWGWNVVGDSKAPNIHITRTSTNSKVTSFDRHIFPLLHIRFFFLWTSSSSSRRSFKLESFRLVVCLVYNIVFYCDCKYF